MNIDKPKTHTELTPEAKIAILAYMIKVVTLPGFLLAVISFSAGFFINDIAKTKAYQEANEENFDRIHNIIEKAVEANIKVNNQLEETEKLVEKTNNLKQQVESIKEIKTMGNIQENLVAALKQQINFEEVVIQQVNQAFSALSWHQCQWKTVGFDKSHHNDTSDWCPQGHFITQLDLDGGEKGGSYPIVHRALCCQFKVE
ncbi:MAG: hypothetical protein SVR94_04930 [Pseudomonadota bacterium]|nr:hypothetical protein [Pseudomonadota bacterium]